jgi:hypothetical protein
VEIFRGAQARSSLVGTARGRPTGNSGQQPGRTNRTAWRRVVLPRSPVVLLLLIALGLMPCTNASDKPIQIGSVLIRARPVPGTDEKDGGAFVQCLTNALTDMGLAVVRDETDSDLVAELSYDTRDHPYGRGFSEHLRLWDARSGVLILFMTASGYDRLRISSPLQLLQRDPTCSTPWKLSAARAKNGVFVISRALDSGFLVRPGMTDFHTRPDIENVVGRVFVDLGDKGGRDCSYGACSQEMELYSTIHSAHWDVTSDAARADAFLTFRWKREPIGRYTTGDEAHSLTMDLSLASHADRNKPLLSLTIRGDSSYSISIPRESGLSSALSSLRQEYARLNAGKQLRAVLDSLAKTK